MKQTKTPYGIIISTFIYIYTYMYILTTLTYIYIYAYAVESAEDRRNSALRHLGASASRAVPAS
jgi:hypothetical protein